MKGFLTYFVNFCYLIVKAGKELFSPNNFESMNSFLIVIYY